MNTQPKIIPLHNPLAEYKALSDEMKVLEARKSQLRDQIFNLMDSIHSDEICIGGMKGKRSLVIQERMDSKRVKEFLGDRYQGFVTEVSQVRLAVI